MGKNNAKNDKGGDCNRRHDKHHTKEAQLEAKEVKVDLQNQVYFGVRT